MSDYIWCHGPKCHERKTTNRVRGVKGSKVLRTMKINVSGNYPRGMWKYFCDQTCLMNFIHEHYQEFIRLHPRPEALETPIDVVVENRYDYYNNAYKTKVIKELTTNQG
tara:strand:+ start:88 stop:414 length:327 start_codon:yes stop_codon:yes gene_type:complete